MEVVYLKEFDNKRMHINRKYKGKYEDKKYEIVYFDEGSMNSKVYYVKNYDKVKLDIGEPDYNLLYSSEWLATHPNGLLNVTYPLGERIESVGSYAVDEEHNYYTAWHVGMIFFTSRYTILNVPMKLYHRCGLTTVRFKPSIYTLPAWLREKNLYQLEYDTMQIIPSTYKSLLMTPPGKLLGVVSMSIRVKNRLLTGCSKIPGVRVRRNAKIETIGHSTGETYGEVVSTRAEGMVKLEENLFVLNKNLFAVTNETISGDSGGGCYLVT
jgi:hypothetical protein